MSEEKNPVQGSSLKAQPEETHENFDKFVMAKRCFAEAIGTAVLVIVGCGAAMGLSLGDPDNYIALAIATSLAFGLVVTALSYALGEFSGCHVNPAVSLALFLDHRIGFKQFVLYVVSQVIGGILGGAVLLGIFGHGGDNALVATLASNTANVANIASSWGWTNDLEALKAGTFTATSVAGLKYLAIALAAEVFFAFVFVFTILCTGHKKENGAVSGIALGLSLTSVVLLGFNITGTGVNPARSIGTAVLAMANGQYEPIKEIWIFIAGPCIGAVLAVWAYHVVWHTRGAHIVPKN